MSLWPPRAARRSGLHRTPCERKREQNVGNTRARAENVTHGVAGKHAFARKRGKKSNQWQARENMHLLASAGNMQSVASQETSAGKDVTCGKSGKSKICSQGIDVKSTRKHESCRKRGKKLDDK